MAQLSQLLLFDPDPSGLDTLTYGFEKDGCSVTGTADPAKARDLAQSSSLPLLVVNLRHSEQVGLDLLRATTSNPRTRNLPCVAIGREDLRSGALAAGAFAFVAVPVFVRDVISVCRMVSAAASPGTRPSPDRELNLRLADLDGVYFLVRALAVTGRSAVVEARHGQARGELRFIDGTVTSSVVGTVQGLGALHQMLLWEDASLHFKFKNVVRRGTQLSMKSSEVLEECDRFLRDFAHEAKDLGVARTIYSAELERVQPSAALPSEVVPVLKLFNGQRDLAQILDESPFRIFDTLKILKRFVSDGAIQLKTPLPAARAEASPNLVGPGALDFWLQKPAPILGSELAASKAPPESSSPGQAGIPVASNGGRSTSPFISVAGGRSATKGAANPPANGAADRGNKAAIAKLRARAATKKNAAEAPARFSEDMVTPPPVAATPPPLAVTPPLFAVTPAAATVMADSVTPAADSVTPAAGTAAATAATPPLLVRPSDRPSDVPPKPAPAVARGEIRITPVPQDNQTSIPERTQSVMVELDALPTPRPLMSNAPAPVSAQAPLPSVIVAPMTPPPVLVAPAPAPAPAPAAALMMPPAVANAAIQTGAPATPSPAGDAEDKRPGRSPSDNFNAIEADFFDREADLYKRESVDSFDDLDTSRSNGTRKR